MPVESPKVAPASREEAPAPAALTFAPAALDRLIEEWMRERIYNSVVSRNTEIVNHVRDSVNDLKRRLGVTK